MHRRTLLLGACLALQACVTRAQVRSAPVADGLSGAFAATCDRVKPAVRDALVEAGFTVREETSLDARRQQFLASQGLASGSAGRIVRAIVEDRGVECAVWVLVESKVQSREAGVADTALARSIHERIAARLSLPPPPVAPASASPGADGVERVFRASLAECFDAALRAFREREYRTGEQTHAGDRARVLAERGGMSASILLERNAGGGTKAAVYVRGRSQVENREEAQRLVGALREVLKEDD